MSLQCRLGNDAFQPSVFAPGTKMILVSCEERRASSALPRDVCSQQANVQHQYEDGCHVVALYKSEAKISCEQVLGAIVEPEYGAAAVTPA